MCWNGRGIAGPLAIAPLPGDPTNCCQGGPVASGLFDVPQAWAHILAVPPVSRVTLDELFNLMCQVGNTTMLPLQCGSGRIKPDDA